MATSSSTSVSCRRKLTSVGVRRCNGSAIGSFDALDAVRTASSRRRSRFASSDSTRFSARRSAAEWRLSVTHQLAKSFGELQIPLPPLEVQKEIVAEIEGYQKVINGARAVLDNYRPHIPIHPDWPMRDLGESVRRTWIRAASPSPKATARTGPFPVLRCIGHRRFSSHDFIFDEDILLISEDGANLLASAQHANCVSPSREMLGQQPRAMSLTFARRSATADSS